MSRVYIIHPHGLHNGEEYAAMPVLIIPRIIQRFLSRFHGERSWKRIFHSKRLTIKFPENKTVSPVEKCGSSLKMQRERPGRQTEFNSSIARTSLLLIIARSPRPRCHRRVFRSYIHTRIYMRARVQESNENQLRGVRFITVTIEYTIEIPRANPTNGAVPEVHTRAALIRRTGASFKKTRLLFHCNVPIQNNEYRAHCDRRFR